MDKKKKKTSGLQLLLEDSQKVVLNECEWKNGLACIIVCTKDSAL